MQPFDLKIKDVAAGYGFSLIAASNQEKSVTVYGCGLNSDSQLGYHEYDGQPLAMIVKPCSIDLRLDPKDEVVKVAAGRSHSFFLTKNSKGRPLFSESHSDFSKLRQRVLTVLLNL